MRCCPAAIVMVCIFARPLKFLPCHLRHCVVAQRHRLWAFFRLSPLSDEFDDHGTRSSRRDYVNLDRSRLVSRGFHREHITARLQVLETEEATPIRILSVNVYARTRNVYLSRRNFPMGSGVADLPVDSRKLYDQHQCE